MQPHCKKIKKSYIQFFTESGLFGGGKMRIVHWKISFFFKKILHSDSSEWRSNRDLWAVSVVPVRDFHKNKKFLGTLNILLQSFQFTPTRHTQVYIPTVRFMPAEITPLSNTRNLYWETPPGNLGTWEQSRNPFRLSHDSAGITSHSDSLCQMGDEIYFFN